MKDESNEIEVLENMPVVQNTQIAIGHNPYLTMIEKMVDRGGDLANLDKMLDLQMKWEANEARKAFNIAFAQFKSEAVQVIKRTIVKDGPLKGSKHANLFDVVAATSEPLARHGLTTAWKLTKDEPALMEITCTLKHSAGHSESVSMSSAPDTGPGRNAIQARGSAKSYLERYTLMAILGLAATDSDDDGVQAGRGEIKYITFEQATSINEWIESVGADKAIFCNWLKVGSVETIPAKDYDKAVNALKAKAKK